MSAILEARVTDISVIKNRWLGSNDLDTDYPSRMPFYLYGTREEMHIDHVLVQAPNAQISAGEVAVELIEGSESVLNAELKDGLIVVADFLPEHLMQPFTADRLNRLFCPGAKLDVSVYHDQNAGQRGGPDLCDNLGKPIARATITLGDNIFVDAHMINLDGPIVTSKAPKKSMVIPRTGTSSQDHPLFRGYGPDGPLGRHPSSWREVWDRALAGRQFAGDNLNSSANSNDSTASDTENDDQDPSSNCLRISFFQKFLLMISRFTSGPAE
jgi:hypothetical protein